MGFFKGYPPEPPREHDMRQLRWAKPEATLPGVVAIELLLAYTDTAVIALTGIRPFPTGLEFTLSTVTRTDDGSAELMLHLTMRHRRVVAAHRSLTTSSCSASSTPTAESPKTRAQAETVLRGPIQSERLGD